MDEFSQCSLCGYFLIEAELKALNSDVLDVCIPCQKKPSGFVSSKNLHVSPISRTWHDLSPEQQAFDREIAERCVSGPYRFYGDKE